VLSPAGLLGWTFRRSVSRLWLRAHRGTGRARGEARRFAEVGRAFWARWEHAAWPLFRVAGRRALHLAAAGLALGAVVGTFVRGLFFQYDMVWRSTFVHDPQTIAWLLRVTHGPAALLLGWPLPDAADAERLATQAGVGAAPWIALQAVTALGVVVVPRALLAWLAARRARSMGLAVAIDLASPYTRALLAAGRELEVGRVRSAIASAAEAESGRFADAVAGFVCTALFDARIAPLVRRFREEGGRVSELEEAIRAACVAFEPEIEAYLPEAQRVFETALARALAGASRELALPETVRARFAEASREIPGPSVARLPGDVAETLTRPVAAAVAASAAAVAGTVGGGFGHHLGIAIVATLLHTTGPVGFLIGAVGGAVAAGGALWLGWDRAREGVRRIPLPGRVTRLVLREGALDDLLAKSREDCRQVVERLLDERLEHVTEDIADRIWARVKPLLLEPGSAEPGERAAAEPGERTEP
jgi:hypothetical protein